MVEFPIIIVDQGGAMAVLRVLNEQLMEASVYDVPILTVKVLMIQSDS